MTPQPDQTDWYRGPFDIHPGAEFTRELVRWECPRHGMHEGVSERGCVLCMESRRLEPRRIVFRASDEERRCASGPDGCDPQGGELVVCAVCDEPTCDFHGINDAEGDWLCPDHAPEEERPCPTCGGRGWHTSGGNDPMPCGRCPAGEAWDCGALRDEQQR